jgi:hypothetical protein
MNRLIRERAVAPLDRDAAGLTPRERRSWWEFCVEMTEFLQNVLRDAKLDCTVARHFAALQWVCLYGTYLFATADPELRAEQRRYAEVCGLLDGAFADAVNDLAGLRDMTARVCGRDHPNPVAVADHLRSREWVRARRPFEWLREAVGSRSADLREIMLTASNVGPTVGWPTHADWQQIFEEALATGDSMCGLIAFSSPSNSLRGEI